jgi:hypothetical protein
MTPLPSARGSIAFLLAALVVACAPGGEPASLRELHRVRSGDLDVVLLSPNEAVRQGTDTLFLEFRSAADGEVTDVGEVKAVATMPMAGMAPMTGGVEVVPTETGGRYSMTTDLSMAGDWRIAIEWDGPLGRGSASVLVSAQ